MKAATKGVELQHSTAYFRDGFTAFKNANLSIASAPVLYGLSVYTVMVASYDSLVGKLYIFRLRDHYSRLANSAKIVGFNGFAKAWTYKKFEKTIEQLLTKNNVRQDVLIRATFFIDELMSGTKMHGLPTSMSIFIYPMKPLYNAAGIHVCISSWQRTPDNAIPSRAKVNGSYINSSLMKNEALLNGYDDAIALDEHGHVSESTVANLFIVKNGKLITPHSATDILEGITRDTIQKLAVHYGVSHEERTVDRSELYTAEEAFLCGTSASITPVLSVDRRVIGSGKAGPITEKLIHAYAGVQLGHSGDFAEWRHEVKAKK